MNDSEILRWEISVLANTDDEVRVIGACLTFMDSLSPVQRLRVSSYLRDRAQAACDAAALRDGPPSAC